jgi:hypothetical protein
MGEACVSGGCTFDIPPPGGCRAFNVPAIASIIENSRTDLVDFIESLVASFDARFYRWDAGSITLAGRPESFF